MYRGFQQKDQIVFFRASVANPSVFTSHASLHVGAGADATFVAASALQLSSFRSLFSHVRAAFGAANTSPQPQQ